MKRKRESIHKYFKPVGSSSRPSEHDATADNVEPSEQNQPNCTDGDAQIDDVTVT